MSDKIYDLLTQDDDINLRDYAFPEEDIAVCESICMRINYIRHAFRHYVSVHPDANFGNDDTVRGYYRRLRAIVPPFISGEILIWKKIL